MRKPPGQDHTSYEGVEVPGMVLGDRMLCGYGSMDGGPEMLLWTGRFSLEGSSIVNTQIADVSSVQPRPMEMTYLAY